MNQCDVLSVIKVDFANLGVGLYCGAIGKDDVKMCVKPLSQCTIQSRCKQVVRFVPKHISYFECVRIGYGIRSDESSLVCYISYN